MIDFRIRVQNNLPWQPTTSHLSQEINQVDAVLMMLLAAASELVLTRVTIVVQSLSVTSTVKKK